VVIAWSLVAIAWSFTIGFFPGGGGHPRKLLDVFAQRWGTFGCRERTPSRARKSDPSGPATGTYKALRGGSWDFYSVGARVPFRYRVEPGNRDDFIGFRCVGE
jgi:hypothetical protein